MINLCCTDFLTFVLLGQVVVTSTVRTPCVASERDTVLMVHGRCGGVRLDGDGGRKGGPRLLFHATRWSSLRL